MCACKNEQTGGTNSEQDHHKLAKDMALWLSTAIEHALHKQGYERTKVEELSAV